MSPQGVTLKTSIKLWPIYLLFIYSLDLGINNKSSPEYNNAICKEYT